MPREKSSKVPSGRRLKFAVFVLASQILLIALAVSWVIHMAIIAKNGSIYFVESNHLILWIEIVGTLLITLFATAVFAIQVYRMGEKRRDDYTGEIRRGGGKEEDS